VHKIPKGLGVIKDIIKRFDKAEKLREFWRSTLQEAYEYALPQKETFTVRSPGQRKARHIYDSTAPMAIKTYAARIQSAHTPPWQQWMDFVSGTDVPKKEREATNQKLEQATEIFFNHLNQSDFSNQSNESDQDMAISTGAMFFEEGDLLANEPLFKFTSIPLSQLYLEPGEGIKNTGWRKHEVRARDLKTMWPDAEFGTELTEKIAKKPDDKVGILNGVLKADGLFHQVVIYKAKKELIFTQSFEESPLIIYRANVTAGESYGRGPVLDVMGDIRTVNKVKEYLLKNGALQMTGVYTAASDSTFNPYTVNIAPGSIIPVATNDSRNPSLKPLENSGRLDVGQLIIEDLQANINRALFANPLGETDDPVKSATEQMLRNQEMLRMSGSSFGRLNTEKVKPIVERGLGILFRNGLLFLGADGARRPLKVDGKQTSIKMQSPLAKAESIEDFQNFQVWLSTMQTLDPAVLALGAQVENFPSWTAEKLGLPAGELVRSKEEIKQASEQVLSQLQQQNPGEPSGGEIGGQAGG